MSERTEGTRESKLGTILGWGSLAAFAIGFGWYVGAPLIRGSRWSDKQSDAIQLVRDYKPTAQDTLYDMIRAYSLKAKDQDIYVGEFNWNAMQIDGAEYQVTLLFMEGSERKVAVWRVNLKTKEAPRPQGDEASSLQVRSRSPSWSEIASSESAVIAPPNFVAASSLAAATGRAGRWRSFASTSFA